MRRVSTPEDPVPLNGNRLCAGATLGRVNDIAVSHYTPPAGEPNPRNLAMASGSVPPQRPTPASSRGRI